MHSSERFLVLGFVGLFGVLMFGSAMASAGPLQDIPEGFAEALGTDTYVAESILSTLIIAAVALVLTQLKMKSQGLLIILIVMIAALTAMSWLDPFVLVAIVILSAALFGRAILGGKV